jgi:hypothetical protein
MSSMTLHLGFPAFTITPWTGETQFTEKKKSHTNKQQPQAADLTPGNR